MSKEEQILDELKKLNRQQNLLLTSGKPSLLNIEMPSANTEYPEGGHLLPKGCKRFLVHCRDGTAFRMAFQKDKVAGSNPPYLTIVANQVYWEDNLNLEEDTFLYFACGSTSKCIEIVQWS